MQKDTFIQTNYSKAQQKMKGISILIVSTMKMGAAQVIYAAEYEDSSCASPYRYSTYTATCLNGRTTIQCNTRAYMRVCSDCKSNNTCNNNVLVLLFFWFVIHNGLVSCVVT